MKLDVLAAPRRGQTQTAFVTQNVTRLKTLLKTADYLHRSFTVATDTESFMQELMATLYERLPEAACIQVTRPGGDEYVHCAIWL